MGGRVGAGVGKIDGWLVVKGEAGVCGCVRLRGSCCMLGEGCGMLQGCGEERGMWGYQRFLGGGIGGLLQKVCHGICFAAVPRVFIGCPYRHWLQFGPTPTGHPYLPRLPQMRRMYRELSTP